VHPVLKAVLDRIPVTQGGALDIGCGLGQVARYLAQRGWSVTAIDISASAIRKAKQLTVPNATITYTRQNSLTLDPTRQFDLVVDYLHLHDIQPEDLDKYISVLAGMASDWIVMGYLCSKGHQKTTRPSQYFEGIVTQHSRSEISAALLPLGFRELAFDQCALRGASTEYQCDIVMFRRSSQATVCREVQQ